LSTCSRTFDQHRSAPELPARDGVAPSRSGDGKAETILFADLYEEHFSFVWRNAQRLLSRAADAMIDDVTQEVFLVALRRHHEFEGRSSPRTWLFGILRNVVHRVRRSSSRRNIRDSADLEGIAAPASSPQAVAEKAQELRIVLELLDGLDDEKREVFILAQLEKMTPAEIAQATGTDVEKIYIRLRDARRLITAAAQRYYSQGGQR
jgi:RNA polymerase sigma-70 factor (ECF subfamily)